MYGKYFASTFTGSMMGAGATVFAVWGYVIANARLNDGCVELNPSLLAAVIGGGVTVDEIKKAIEYLMREDPHSRNSTAGGARLERQGQFLYRVINHNEYKRIQNEEDRKTYMRDYMRAYRDKLKEGGESVNSETPVNTGVNSLVNSGKPQLTHKEKDKEKDKEEEKRYVELEANSTAVPPATPLSPESATTSPPAPRAKTSRKPSSEVSEVFAAWQTILGHPKAVLDDKRQAVIAKALQSFPVDELCKVPLGVKNSAWHMGQNEDGRVYDSVELVFRGADKIEYFLEKANGNGRPALASAPDPDAERRKQAQKECGCWADGGMMDVIVDGKRTQVECDHNHGKSAPPPDLFGNLQSNA